MTMTTRSIVIEKMMNSERIAVWVEGEIDRYGTERDSVMNS